MVNNLIGQHLGPYRILEQIGTGGMATVYKAYQPAMDRYVAIKVIAAHFAQDETFLRRFRREAKAVAQLEHAHILPVHDYGEAEGRPYLVMRFLEAGTLKDRIVQGSLPLTEVNRIVGQVGSALDYAHRMGVVHRDVKPTNILLDAEGDAFLTDFGLAKMMESSVQLTATGVGIGTPAYMSPEQGKGAKVDSRADVYSLGVMLYEMVTGHAPYEAETPLAVVLKHIQEPLPLPRSVRPDLPEEVERVILRAMAKEPDDRFQTAGEMVRALDGAVRASEAAARTEPGAVARAEPTVAGVAAGPAEGSLARVVASVREALPAGWGRVAVWVAAGAVALLILFLVLSRVPLRVQISGGQLEVVRVVEGTPVPSEVEGAEGTTPTPAVGGLAATPTPIPTHTPAPISVAGTPAPLEQGEILGYFNDDVCIFDYQGGATPMGLAETFICFSGLSWSPDGSRFVFSACHTDDARDPSQCHNDLYITDRDGSNITALVHDLDANFFPAWSPDGEWIAFHDNSAVAIIRPDGTDENILVSGGNTCPQAMAWSPDSQRIAWLGELGFCETGESRDVWVVNRDGSGMNTIFHSSDQVLENQVAWSPDGVSVAVLTTDGVTYLTDADCANQPNGCDESSRTEIVTFPEHWMHTYYPQWAGEEGAPPETAAPTPSPGSPADQARAFAEPILATIADRPPDFEDDFSTADKGWGLDQFEIIDGVVRATLVDGNTAGLGPPWLVAKDFVLSFDSRQVSGSYGSGQTVNLGLPGGFLSFSIASGTRNWDSGKMWDDQWHSVPSGGGDVVSPIGEINHILVVARGPRVAFYLNDVPVVYVEDNDFDVAHDVWFMCNGQPDIVCEFDNIKIWNLEDMPGLPAFAVTPATSPAATVLAYWPFDGDLKDASGNGYDLQQTGENLEFVSGCFGQAIHFNGDATSYLTRGQDDDALDFGSHDYSIELWVKFDRMPSESDEQTLIEKCSGEGCGITGWGVTVMNDNSVLFIQNQGWETWETDIGGSLPDDGPNQWYHIVAVRQGENAYVYANGEQIVSGPAGDLANGDNPLILGRRFEEWQLFPTIGALDEVTIYEGALSAAEVRDHYQRGASCAGAAATPMPSPGSPADKARAFAEPILAAIADRPPDYEDDFGDPGSGWPIGPDPDGGERGYEDGAYHILAQYDHGIGVWPDHELWFSDLVLEVDAQFVSGEWGNWDVIFRNWPGTIEQPGNAEYSVSFYPDGAFNVGKSVRSVHMDLLGYSGHAPTFEQGFETNHLMIIAQGPQIAFYVNGEPLWFVYDESSSRGTIELCAASLIDNTTLGMQFDNLRIWDISDLPLSSAEAGGCSIPTSKMATSTSATATAPACGS